MQGRKACLPLSEAQTVWVGMGAGSDRGQNPRSATYQLGNLGYLPPSPYSSVSWSVKWFSFLVSLYLTGLWGSVRYHLTHELCLPRGNFCPWCNLAATYQE